MSGHSIGSLTMPRCKIGTRLRPGNSELTQRIHYKQPTESAADGVSILALKPMGRVNRSPKQRVPAAKQNDNIVIAKILKKTIKSIQCSAKYPYWHRKG